MCYEVLGLVVVGVFWIMCMCLKVTFSLMSVVDIFRFLRFGSEFELIQFLAFQIKYKMRAWGGIKLFLGYI